MQLKQISMAIAAAFGITASAGVLAQQAGAPVAKWGPYIDLEGKLGSKRNIGEGNIFVPIVQDARTLYFANARARLDDESDNEGSLGLGVRHMLENGWNLGAYGFVDHRRTAYDNSYDQTTLGLEALGRDIDLRANLYTPFGKDSSTLSTSHAASVSGASVYVTTTLQEERVLPGFDVEAGWRLPFFDVEDAKQVRTYLAGYRFSDDGIKVQGARLRAELVLAEFSDSWKGSQLTLGAEFQDDNARGSQGFVGLRLRIPLGETAAASRRLNAQERRMAAPVVRDVDIVSQVRTRKLAPEIATQTADGKTFTVISSGTTTDLNDALADAGANSTVVLAGKFDTTVSTVLQNGQTMIGSGAMKVVTASGRSAQVTLPGATINAEFASFGAGTRALVTMANDSTIKGMNLVSTDVAGPGVNYRGINVIGVSNVRILNNTLTQSLNQSPSSSSTGIGVENSANVIIGNNTVNASNANSNAAGLVVLDSSVKVYNNSFSGQGVTAGNSFGILLADTTGTSLTILPGSTGNAILNGSCDIPIFNPVGTIHLSDGTTCP